MLYSYCFPSHDTQFRFFLFFLLTNSDFLLLVIILSFPLSAGRNLPPTLLNILYLLNRPTLHARLPPHMNTLTWTLLLSAQALTPQTSPPHVWMPSLSCMSALLTNQALTHHGNALFTHCGLWLPTLGCTTPSWMPFSLHLALLPHLHGFLLPLLWWSYFTPLNSFKMNFLGDREKEGEEKVQYFLKRSLAVLWRID